MALASDLENRDVPSNSQRHPPSDLPEVLPLTEPDSSSNVPFSSSIPAPTPAQRIKTSNILEKEEESHLGHGSTIPRRKFNDHLMAQSVSRKIPRPISPVPHDHTNPIISVLAPNSDIGSQPIISQSQSQSQSQSSRLSNYHNYHAQAESSIDHENSRALLRGIMVDLKARECPFLDLSRVKEILERTHTRRYGT